MADAANDDTTEQVFSITDRNSPIRLTAIIRRSFRIHMHQELRCTHLDFPFVTHFGSEIVQHREFTQGFVPPINLVVAFIDVFVCLFSTITFVVKGVDTHQDMSRFVIDNGIGSIF